MEKFDLIDVLGILCAVALPIGGFIFVLIKSITAKHAEKMAMIEKGSLLEDPKSNKISNKSSTLRNGLLLLGMGLGGIIGISMNELCKFDNPMYEFIFIILFITFFGGVGLTTAYFILYGLRVVEKEDTLPKESEPSDKDTEENPGV